MYVYVYLCIYIYKNLFDLSLLVALMLGCLQSSPSLDRMTSLVSQVTDRATTAGASLASTCTGCEAGKYSATAGAFVSVGLVHMYVYVCMYLSIFLCLCIQVWLHLVVGATVAPAARSSARGYANYVQTYIHILCMHVFIYLSIYISPTSYVRISTPIHI